ncbi:hypothetical protein DAKH74_056550 [Maudiozyma humilis]|uniref:Uncharacterized protein n=1 Tax=Maudiozyma humilis TaxID=51915 RepID=A0AAV5SB79_MAUHU|nr:hypothetical protein DAKH74_056550 [Kazachstania humilis]
MRRKVSLQMPPPHLFSGARFTDDTNSYGFTCRPVKTYEIRQSKYSQDESGSELLAGVLAPIFPNDPKERGSTVECECDFASQDAQVETSTHHLT